jgi:hypothetical protein
MSKSLGSYARFNMMDTYDIFKMNIPEEYLPEEVHDLIKNRLNIRFDSPEYYDRESLSTFFGIKVSDLTAIFFMVDNIYLLPIPESFITSPEADI